MNARTAIPTMLVASLLLIPAVGSSDIRFEDATDILGPFGQGESWGASWGDLDADGWPDLFLNNHRLRAALYRNEGPNGFRDVTIQADRSNTWILTPWNDQHGAVWGDYNNDGLQDLLVSTGRVYDEQLFENVGGAFVDRTAWSGINGIGVGDGRHGTWLDINDDGLLDLISVNFSDNLFWERQASGSTGFVRANAAYGVDYVCLFGNHAVQLLDATGDGRFEVLCVNDATFPSALLDTATVPFTNLKAMLPPQPLVNDVALGDFNGNLRTDILVLRGGLRPNEALQVGPNAIEAYNQVGENSGSKGFRFRTDGVVTFDVATIQFWEGYVFIGANGWNPPNVKDLSFVLDAADPQTWGIQQHDPSLTTRGIYVGFDPASQTWDVQVHSDDGGRRSYFLVTSTQPISQVESTGLNGHDLPWTPQLFRNTESGFEEGTFASGLGVPLSCASVVTGDFDNDGDLDLYFVCRGGAQNLPNRLFENQGDGTFAEVDVTGAVGAVGFNVADGAGTGDSVAVADVDLDGYLDLFVTNGLNMDPLDYGGPNQLFRNLGGSNKWIMLDLVGVQSNRDAVGAKVFATAGGKAQLREQAGGTHRWSQNHQRIHFGVAQSSTVDLRIEWPSGQIDEYSGLSVNELYRVTEGLAIDVVDRVPPPDRPGPQPGDECGAPIYDLYRDPGVFVWKECDTGHWRVRVSGGGIPETVQYNGYISATRSFPSLTPVGLEGLDQVVATNTNRIDYRLYVASAGDDGFDFDLPPDGRACFSLDEPPRGSIYVGARRQQVSSPFDLETLGPCPILSALSADDVAVNEADGTAEFVVTLSSPSAAPVTVSYATADGTATAGEDYESTSGVLTFAPGETVQVVEVAVLDDTAPEATESFDLVLSEASGATIARGRAVGTILDDDTPLSCGQPSYAAGSEAGVFLWQDCANARWHARVTAGGSGAAITYRGEIVASEPFTQAQGVLLELPWDVVDVTDPTRLGFTLGVAGTGQDGLAFAFPADADVCFGLDAPAGAQVYVGVGKTAVATPFDLTTLGACVPPPVISISDTALSEGDGPASVVVTLSVPRSVPVTVSYATVDGTATAGEDYESTSGVLTFVPGETVQVVEVAVIDDNAPEPTETFGVLLSNAVGAALGQATATVSILDDDVPLPELSVGDVTASEGDGVLGFVVSLSAASAVPVTVGYATVDGTALAGSDYLPVGESEGLTFQPGETTKTVNVELIDDDIPEPTKTLYLELIAPDVVVLTRAQGTATILDDDGALLELSVSDVTVGEDAGVAGFAVSLSGASAAPVTVSYATADGTATAGEDYESTSGVLTFAPGETVQVVEVAVFDDTAPEATESFDLVLSEASGATIARGRAVGTILDDDTPLSCGQPSYAAGSEAGVFLWQDCANARWHAWVTAGGSGAAITYRGEIVASEPFTQAQGVLLELPWDVVDVTDPTRIGFTLGVRGTGQDGLAFAFPADADVCFGLDAPAGAQVYVGVGKTAVATPFDLTTLGACVPPPVISISDTALSEADGPASVVVTLSVPRSVPVTVSYATVDGTATAGEDYESTSGVLTFVPGETVQVVEVAVIDDNAPEPTETFGVLLSNAVGAALGQATATVSILDDDGALLELSVSDVTVGEDAGVAGFAVSLSGASAAPVTVSYATADGTATAGEDYESTSGVLTFAPGETVQVVEVAVFDDTAPDATESFDLVLSEASGATIARGRAVGTILDDDTPLSCGQPSYAAGSEAGVFLWQDCANARWHAWVTAGGSGAVITYTGEIVASEPFTQAQGELLELPWDVVDVTDPTRIGFTLGVRGTGQDGLAFAFPADADVCFGLDAPAGAQVYVGVGKTAVATPFDLNTLGSCVALP